MEFFFKFFICLCGVEVFLFVFIRQVRRTFQWVLIGSDRYPEIDFEGYHKFKLNSFHPELGWDRKPFESKQEEIKTAGEWLDSVQVSTYTTDSEGSRCNPGFEGRKVEHLVCGDSFAFGRHVDDSQTWAHYLSILTGTNVVNRGVGNFGIDQAVLKLEQDIVRFAPKTAILMIVPETIARLLSVWKHYYEYGNVFGFKGRYFLIDGKLEWISNPAQSVNSLESFRDAISVSRKFDPFYKKKFLKDLLGFPHFISVFRNPVRNFPVLFFLFISKVFSLVTEKQSQRYVNAAWAWVLKCNDQLVQSLYRDRESVELLQSIVKHFCEVSKRAGARPVLAVAPYLSDLHEASCYYHDAFNVDDPDLIAIDLWTELRKLKGKESLYVSSFNGAHLSPSGNREVAEIVFHYLKTAGYGEVL